ncbi:metal ABC transporter ATP-binding protein [Enterovirga rhinocerotis]|uniref:Zinc/manganese transport system ATP-binding protein n=1 Tax=Enterovirga rhinocerotis TaxID=1339210 RepID=A0A4R7C557_9HYPH|nr:ABC transporter ATP-binding protein [Enterovirga rhinocerotis]TDR93291.1 zinc/manganese transport system ATP-binding protein [Enterovirga rhinocerotis]
MTSAGSPALVFHDLTLGYDRRPAVHHLDGIVHEGDLLAVVGPNGAGKSTFLNGIVGQVATLGGRLDLCGRTVRDFAYLPQRAEIDASFPINVHDFVATGAWRRLGAWRRAGREEELRIADALARVSLTGFEARPIGTLSGGQLQRALFARTIVQDARLILLDEPCAAVDTRTSEDLLAVMTGWHRERRTVIAALHDLDQVRRAFPRTLLLARNPVAWGSTAEVLTPENLVRSRQLVEAWSSDREPCADDGHGPSHGHAHDHATAHRKDAAA